MITEIIPIQGVWHLLRWLPSFLFRCYFTRERLAQLIYVDVRPRHDSVVVDLGQVAFISLYLQAINLSPFLVELDRASFHFWLGGAKLNALILNKQAIASGEITTLNISANIPDGLATQMAGIRDNPVALDGNIEFNCAVRAFSKNIGHLDGINPKILNVNARKNM